MNNQSCRWNEDEEEVDDFQTTTVTVCEPTRVILHLDVDCFEVQLWMQKLRPDLIGKDVPVIVVNLDGIILSVNYTAKSLGVKQGEGRQALEDARLLVGSELVEITPAERFGKADSFLPLTESNNILDSFDWWLQMWNQDRNSLSSITIERTCRDKFYIDVTDLIDEIFESDSKKEGGGTPSQQEINELNKPKNHPHLPHRNTPITTMEGRRDKIIGEEYSFRIRQVYPSRVEAYHRDELRLVHGAVIANSIIRYIEEENKYQVSAGVGHSKLIAKLACSLNKPKGICIVTDVALPRLSKKILFQDLPGFGGKIGNALQNLLSSTSGKTVKYIADILQASNDGIDLAQVFQELDFSNFESRALDLYNKCQFKDESRVTSKVHPDTISTALSFKGCQRKREFKEGVSNIAQDIEKRINYCKVYLGRIAKELVVRVEIVNTPGVTPRPPEFSNSMPLPGETKQFVGHGSIRRFILDHINTKSLNWKNILKIHVTAKNILQVNPNWRYFAFDSDERDTVYLWPTDDESESDSDDDD